MNFLKHHGGWVLAIVLGLASWVYAAGAKDEKLDANKQHIDRVDREGGEYGRATRAVVDQHTTQITEMRSDQKEYNRDMSEVKGDLKAIRTILEEQKQRPSK
jgi:hypothetical protein